jgi:superfamily II DNA/RNA helicase
MVTLLTDMNRFTVIDEADELLSTGWEEAMEKLFQGSGTLTSIFLHSPSRHNIRPVFSVIR